MTVQVQLKQKANSGNWNPNLIFLFIFSFPNILRNFGTRFFEDISRGRFGLSRLNVRWKSKTKLRIVKNEATQQYAKKLHF